MVHAVVHATRSGGGVRIWGGSGGVGQVAWRFEPFWRVCGYVTGAMTVSLANATHTARLSTSDEPSLRQGALAGRTSSWNRVAEDLDGYCKSVLYTAVYYILQ